MATRPAKTGGNTTYVAEVAGGNTLIKASEVDGDLLQIYTNIDNSNVAAAAAIAYSKLNLSNSIVAGDLTASSVTNPKLAANAVTIAKMGPNSIFRQLIDGGNEAVTDLVNGVETIVVEDVFATTPVGGLVLVHAVLGGEFVATGTTVGNITLTVRLRQGGTAGVADGTLLRTMILVCNPDNINGGFWQTPGTVTTFYMSAATSVRYKLTAFYTIGAVTAKYTKTFAYLHIAELA